MPREPIESELERAIANSELLLETGEALLAFEALRDALERWPDSIRLRQLRGLALARGGATVRANESLRELRDEGHRDGETLGLLARTHKDLANAAADPAERQAQLEKALGAYHEGFAAALRDSNRDDALFTGVNAATVSLLSGEPEQSAIIAREVRTLGREQLVRDGSAASYWLHATLGETALLLGEHDEAAVHYRLAAERAAGRHANLSSSRDQARTVLACRKEDPAWLDEILKIPPVAVFSGHMVDNPTREVPRFPAIAEAAVAAVLRERLAELNPSAAYASAACGGDLLFLEAARERGCEYHVVLPFPPDAFAATSIDFAVGDSRNRSWRERFDTILEGAASVTVTSDHVATGSTLSFEYANLVLSGLAALHAAALHVDVAGVVVWDGNSGDGPGGTASVVEQWQSRGRAVYCIDPQRPAESGFLEALTAGDRVDAGSDIEQDDAPHQLMAMLFADAVGYSKLSEDQIPLFVEHFLTPIAQLIERSDAAPILKETAGDGFYFVFRNVRDAGVFGLALRDVIADIDWKACGLPASMGMRVALHCGPVHSIKDPITGQQKYTGPHTSRAARIEPITPPGQIYASQAFATIAAASGVGVLAFEYVGRTALAKKYGSLGLYHVRPAHA
jgi:tetratricopeptide (TPR) repeat protein